MTCAGAPRLAAPVMVAAPPGPVGVAVSGGGDSVALLLLAQDWAAREEREIAAVTVDHRLRPDSAAEAAAVAALCAGRGIAHEILVWEGWDGRGNLQHRAREARRRLIGDWACVRGIGAVALGHSLEDQAETVVMRLARGSGVDGLSAMAPVSAGAGLLWLRPLLGVERAALRGWLAAQGVRWAEDPGNASVAFERVRARAALAPLAALGLTPRRLAATAERMGVARAALEGAVGALARECLSAGEAGDLTLDPGALARAPLELRLRLLAGALGWVSGAVYRPRLASLEAALGRIETGALGHGFTLHGCVVRPRGAGAVLRREPERVAPRVPAALKAWDGRWQLEGRPPQREGLAIGALGAVGLARIADWRARGVAREALVTTPALWQGETLIAAPLVEPVRDWRFRRISAVPAPWQFITPR